MADIMIYDRDGVVLSAPLFEDTHPKNISPESIKGKIDPAVAAEINKEGGIILSNQDRASEWKPKFQIREEFQILMQEIPGLKLCLWSIPDEDGIAGNKCDGLLRTDGGVIVDVVRKSHFQGIIPGWFRKPKQGMFELARDLGFSFDFYIGHLSGVPGWGWEDDIDRETARNAKVLYLDVQKAFPDTRTRSGMK